MHDKPSDLQRHAHAALLTRSSGHVDDRGSCRIESFPDTESGTYASLRRCQQRDRRDERNLRRWHDVLISGVHLMMNMTLSYIVTGQGD